MREVTEASLLKDGRPLSFLPEMLARRNLELPEPSRDGEPGTRVLRSANDSISSGSSCMVTAEKRDD
jgi:hypothetical protein